jgi:uncharacterized membrane protein
MSFQQAMEHVAQVFEAVGALVLVTGLVVSIGLAVRSWRHDHVGLRAWQVLRDSFGNVILLGLEILVAADLVRTVAVAPTIENVVILGVIVLIRTLLSFSLEVEIEGVAPWRRALTTGSRRRGTWPDRATTPNRPGTAQADSSARGEAAPR